jgi:Zn-dependent protease with chaperone function
MPSNYQTGYLNDAINLTKPTAAFKRRVLLAIAGLFVFVFIYIGLMIWFGMLSYNLFATVAAGSDSPFLNFILAFCLAFLCVFMFKSLLVFEKNKDLDGLEITEEQEPLLFNYINQLADEAKAPRPHKVVLSSRVNASVFYHLSILNLLFPSKKNLEIGLGLINVLNTGEFKAVLAHEFGHFAQRSMMLGRYVYVAQQIATKVVNKRDALDAFLAGLSQIDIRIAWIGWILSILVWAVRSLIEVLFSIVAIAERALKREMEFQADLVSVSLAGSDAIIHALYKLKIADEANRVAVDTINVALNEKKAVQDMFVLQTNYIEQMRFILDAPTYGLSPNKFGTGKDNLIFTSKDLHPPEMWASHPSDKDREENAKRIYIPAKIDATSAWTLFSQSTELRKAVTDELVKTAKVQTSPISDSEAIELMNKEYFNWTFLNPKYKGSYLKRYSFINFESVADAYDLTITGDLKEKYKQLYTDELTQLIEDQKQNQQDIIELTNIRYEVLTAERRIIMFRGSEIKRSKIPELILELKKEGDVLRQQIMAHDRLCRKLNYDVAKSLNPAVAEYLKSVSQLVHFAEHSLAGLSDMAGQFVNHLHVLTIGGRVNSEKIQEIIRVANKLHTVLENIYAHAESIEVDAEMEKKLGGKSFQHLLSEFKLEMATAENINSWVQSAESWNLHTMDCLNKLRNASLERLLSIEDSVSSAFLNNQPLSLDFTKNKCGEKYSLQMPGQERPLKYDIDLWARFRSGIGLIPSIAKFSVSGGILFFALLVANMSQDYKLIIYNGLNIPVDVQINENEFTVEPLSSNQIEIEYDATYAITASSNNEIIESFEIKVDERSPYYIYNVANAGYFVEYTVSYGYETFAENVNIGSPRWFMTNSDYILEEPPTTLYTSENGTTKTALTALSQVDPFNYPEVGINKDSKSMIMSHCLWDNEEGGFIYSWLTLGTNLDKSLAFTDTRLKRNPDEIVTVRLIQDYGSDEQKIAIQDEYLEKAKQQPENPNIYYLYARSLENGAAQDSVFLFGYSKWPEHAWLSFAAGYIFGRTEEWEKAYSAIGNSVNASTTLSNLIGIDLERIRKLVDPENKEAKYELALNQNQTVNYYRLLEKGDEATLTNNFDKAYYLLSQGQLSEALSFIEDYPEEHQIGFKWLVAGSDEAPLSVVEEMLILNPDSAYLNINTVWMSIAVMAKSNKNYIPFVEKLVQLHGDEAINLEQTNSFIQMIVKRDISAATEILTEVDDFRYRLRYKLMAVILLGNETPAKWQYEVDQMLYILEKPYFSPDNGAVEYE